MSHPAEPLCPSSVTEYVDGNHGSPLCQNNRFSIFVFRGSTFSPSQTLLLLLENIPWESMKANRHMLEQLVKYGLRSLIIKYSKWDSQIQFDSGFCVSMAHFSPQIYSETQPVTNPILSDIVSTTAAMFSSLIIGSKEPRDRGFCSTAVGKSIQTLKNTAKHPGAIH